MKHRMAVLIGAVALAIIASAILGTGLVKTTIDKDGWDGYGSPGMVLISILGVWAISNAVRAIKR